MVAGPVCSTRFGQFDLDTPRRQIEFEQQTSDVVYEERVEQLPGGDVDRHAGFRPVAMVPVRGRFDRLAQYPVAHFDDEDRIPR